MAYSTINKSSDYMNTVLYTGNGSTQSITGVGFQPDLSWFKNRTSGQSHVVVDVVRGRKGLFTDNTSAELTFDATKDFTSFDSDGFTVGIPHQANSFNYNTGSIVAWNWKANGAGSSNTDGQITSTVSVNTTAGFSIVKFDLTGEGATTKTVGHGLGVVPKMIITKPLGAIGWHTWHTSLGTDYVVLNTNAAKTSSANFMNSEVPTASTFKIGDTSNSTFWNNNDCIAYCFAEIPGYSKFGSYIHNGQSGNNGNFIYTGMKPKFIILKNTSSGSTDWLVQDTTRSTFNEVDDCLFVNEASAESVNFNINFLSNGFKLSGSGPTMGSSGNTVIYMAFGQPIVSNSGVCATAR